MCIRDRSGVEALGEQTHEITSSKKSPNSVSRASRWVGDRLGVPTLGGRCEWHEGRAPGERPTARGRRG
eukprot:5477756-Alexandrium_andersonii.AAC.1